MCHTGVKLGDAKKHGRWSALKDMTDLFPDNAHNLSPEAAASEGSIVNLRDVMLLFRRRRWLIGCGTVLGTAAALIVASASEPQYTAQASVVVDPQSSAVAGMREATDTLRVDPVTLTTQVDVVRSREHVYRVVSDLELYNDTALNGVERGNRFDRWLPLPAGSMDRLGRLAQAWFEPISDKVSQWLAGTGWAGSLPSAATAAPILEQLVAEPDEPRPVDFERTVDAFVKRYQVRRADDSQVISLRFTHPDPHVATEIVNRAADLYVERLLRDKEEQADRVAEWVKSRFAELQQVVRASEQKLENFRAEEGLISVVDGSADAEQVSRQRQELASAEATFGDLRSRIAIIDRHARNNDLDAILGILSSPLLDRLRQEELNLASRELDLGSRYGPRHPQLQALHQEKERLGERITQEIGRLRFELQSEASIVQARIGSITEHLAALQSELARRQLSQVQLGEFQREATANRELGELFREYYKSVSEQRAIIESDARVLAYGKPPGKPSSLSPRLFTLIGLVAAFTGSTLFAIALESMDRRVRSARQIERQFKVRVIEAVPQFGGHGRGRNVVTHITQRPRAAFPEAVRSVYTTIRLKAKQTYGAVTLVVCSALSEEGKTTFVVSLATIAAQWGQRAIVVDLDLRHPSVANVLGVRPGSGLRKVIQDGLPFEEAIYRTAFGFDILSTDESPRDPASLIGDPSMKQLIARLRNNYDLVVIDTAPLLAVSDGRLAAQLGDSVVLVARWLSTPLSAVRRSLQMLRDCHADTAGIILNRVNPQKYMYYENEDGSNYYKNIEKYYRS